MLEGSKGSSFQTGPRCIQCHKEQGIHEINFNIWLCDSCYAARNRDANAPKVDWTLRDTVESLLEAVYYWNWIQRDKKYRWCEIADIIKGDRGIVCYVAEQNYMTIDPFQQAWAKDYRYYIVYNRSYLSYGDRRFERASMHKGDWQTIRTDVVDRAIIAAQSRMFKNHVRIAIVMANKAIWYVDPILAKKFAFEYETEDIPFKEQSPEIHIPISTKKENMISRHDPFET